MGQAGAGKTGMVFGEIAQYVRRGVGGSILLVPEQYSHEAERELCAAAKIPVEKGSPRCLRRLYLAGRKAIEDNIAMLVEQALERQTEEEQLSVAWETA